MSLESAAAPRPLSPVPCLAGLYLALGDDEAPRPRVSPATRAVAAAAAALLAIGMAGWPALADVERPAATLPEWPELTPDDAPDRAG